jgi:tRNA-binding protein
MSGEHVVVPGEDRYAPERLATKAPVDAAHFHALDLRVGRVIAAEPLAGARKPALRVRVDFGPVLGELETSAQITRYEPGALIGRQVVGAVNLGVRRIAGVESRFLLLGGLHPDGSVALLGLDEELAPGSSVG